MPNWAGTGAVLVRFVPNRSRTGPAHTHFSMFSGKTISIMNLNNLIWILVLWILSLICIIIIIVYLYDLIDIVLLNTCVLYKHTEMGPNWPGSGPIWHRPDQNQASSTHFGMFSYINNKIKTATYLYSKYCSLVCRVLPGRSANTKIRIIVNFETVL